MGFASESRERSRPVLPLAGMVDILFLLLIFFMSTYSMREQELVMEVGLPAAETANPGTTGAQKVIITFDKDDRIFLGQRFVPIDQLKSEIAKLVEINPNQPVIIRGDSRGNFGLGIKIADTARVAGLTDVQFAVQEAE